MAPLWGGAPGWRVLEAWGPRTGPGKRVRLRPVLKGPSERRVYGRGRPHACQGGRARAGQQAEPGWAGREGAQGRAGAGGQAASRSGQRTAGGAWNLADLALPRPPRHLGPSPTSWARAHRGGLHSPGDSSRSGGGGCGAGRGPRGGTCREGPGPTSSPHNHLQNASCMLGGRPGSPRRASWTPQTRARAGAGRAAGSGEAEALGLERGCTGMRVGAAACGRPDSLPESPLRGFTIPAHGPHCGVSASAEMCRSLQARCALLTGLTRRGCPSSPGTREVARGGVRLLQTCAQVHGAPQAWVHGPRSPCHLPKHA